MHYSTSTEQIHQIYCNCQYLSQFLCVSPNTGFGSLILYWGEKNKQFQDEEMDRGEWMMWLPLCLREGAYLFLDKRKTSGVSPLRRWTVWGGWPHGRVCKPHQMNTTARSAVNTNQGYKSCLSHLSTTNGCFITPLGTEEIMWQKMCYFNSKSTRWTACLFFTQVQHSSWIPTAVFHMRSKWMVNHRR